MRFEGSAGLPGLAGRRLVSRRDVEKVVRDVGFIDSQGLEPPSSNTGARNTGEGARRALIDWLSGTLATCTSVDDVIGIFGVGRDDWVPFDTGKYGWSQTLRIGHIAIYHGGRQAGVHIEISGQGCREFEAMGGDWVAFLREWRGRGGRLSRLDLAIDDFDGSLWDVEKLLSYGYRGLIRSPFWKGRRVEDFELATGAVDGRTLYLGRPSSRIQVRFYDKSAERRSKGYELEEGVRVWNRAEVQLRDERAEECADILIQRQNAGEIVAGILRRYVQFVRRTADENRARWPVCDWWERWLGYVEPLRLARAAPDRTVERTWEWMMRQVACAMAVLDRLEPGREWVEELVREGDGRWREIHEMLVRSGEEWERERYLRRLADAMGIKRARSETGRGK